ncbi:hypothetical protein DXT99_25170 [Pontibacter diazotrophicus]|uniref:DNA-binding protein n=1 Tax=Pontibacter diazotrophicus TaxID=1400979 RepID=A0A3D8L1N4_9BACT|nr:hypothetical protein [Pontibacter diazotrophicus]RDV11107.1 hypothetical protein DXT99_25170 [Pontibacter diazotrophicus]
MADKAHPRFVTPYKYAQLCGVSDSAIYQRIERGQLEVHVEQSLDGKEKRYVDTEKFPPEKLIDYPIQYKGKKKKKE